MILTNTIKVLNFMRSLKEGTIFDVIKGGVLSIYKFQNGDDKRIYCLELPDYTFEGNDNELCQVTLTSSDLLGAEIANIWSN